MRILTTAVLLQQLLQRQAEAGGSLKRTKTIKQKNPFGGLEAKHLAKVKPLIQHDRFLSGEPPVTDFPDEECPPMGEGMCTLEYMPVLCGPNSCEYDNGCNAELAGFNLDDDCVPKEEEPEVEEEEVPEEGEGEGEAPPANDMCENAMPMESGDVVMGSVEFATADEVPACNDFLGGSVNGVWYVVEGTGSGLGGEVNATFDVQGAVFTGSCGELVCVDGSAGEYFPWTYGEIKGSSIEGETYYVIVSGWEGASGTFEFTMTDGDVPPNNYCEDAISIELGESVDGTTAYSRRPDPGTVPECSVSEALIGITSPTVWYSFVGTGSIVQFSVFADYDAQISIYEGDDCSSLDCWNQNDDSPIDGPSSLIVQPLEEGQLYYIAVNGFGRQYGTFTIESEEVTPAPNDACTDAIPLEAGVAMESDTLAASGDADLPLCGLDTNETSPGIWFSVVGTGNTMQVVLNNTYETHIAVYTGSCDELECAGSNFFAYLPFTWDTTEGEEYYVYAYGRQHALTDTFSILTSEVERPSNDVCTEAIPVETNAAAIAGTTRYSSAEPDLEFCGEVSGLEEYFGGVWYSFEGNGDTQLVGVSSGVNNTGLFDVVISVYSGSCDELKCLDGNDEGSTFEDYENAILLDTEEGVTYYVFVYGFGTSRGDFEIGLLSVPRPENDDCSTAEALELGDSLSASTQFASMEDDWSFETCGTSNGNSTGPGIWYSVVGGGFPVQASIIGQYDIQLTVFTGTCDALECVDGTDGNENDFFNGRVIWDAEDGVEYYILVHGYNNAFGEFELFYETAITRN